MGGLIPKSHEMYKHLNKMLSLPGSDRFTSLPPRPEGGLPDGGSPIPLSLYYLLPRDIYI